jgi:mRNA interferase YafQ
MRTIEYGRAFKKDFKRLKASPRFAKDVAPQLERMIELLAGDEPLPIANRDHDLTGNWCGYRECHIRPDVLLIYKKTDNDLLRLARLGSHSELFG